MKEKLKEWIEKIKAFWANRSKKQKIGIISGAAGILLIALAATVMLNAKPEDNRVLFPGMSTSETQQVYALLREREVDAEINRKGELVVPAAQWETLTFELAGAGYQPTSPNYNFFLDNSGFTKTELEQQATLKFQMEDRMRQLLLAQTGVEYADVSFNIAEESNYIWDQQKQQEGSAAITIRMREDFELTPERVQAVKNLTAYAVPSMKADNVVVIDGRTGLEVLGTEDPDTNQYSTKQLELEQAVAKSIGVAGRRDGYLEGNGYLVSWCVGHLVELSAADSYDPRYSRWTREDLPILPEPWRFSVSPATKKQFEILKDLMERPDVTELVEATDAGREGELIFRLVYDQA